jgi:segregation and condensation protein A
MQPNIPENTNAPKEPQETDSSVQRDKPLEVMSLEELGVGSDRSAGTPDSWEVDPAEEKPSPDNNDQAGLPGTQAFSAEPSGKTEQVNQGDHSQPDSSDIFNVKLDVFEGPLELLLHLLREHQVDISDIPIAFITDQYLKYIDMMQQLNINVASEYLVMASWLVYMKSRTLLPQQEGEAEAEEDPDLMRLELQRQLLEYQKFKKLSAVFRDAEEEQSGIFSRGGNGDGILLDPETEEEETPQLQVTVFDLISAIQKMIDEAGEAGVHLVEIDELEVADRKTFLLDMLEEAGADGVNFHKLFEGQTRALEIVVTFLAILELVRLNLILATQSAMFGEIRIHKAVNEDD